jgi:hypothetical protein
MKVAAFASLAVVAALFFATVAPASTVEIDQKLIDYLNSNFHEIGKLLSSSDAPLNDDEVSAKLNSFLTDFEDLELPSDLETDFATSGDLEVRDKAKFIFNPVTFVTKHKKFLKALANEKLLKALAATASSTCTLCQVVDSVATASDKFQTAEEKLFAEHSKLFSPSGREDDPGFKPESVIQNFERNEYMPSNADLLQMNKNSYEKALCEESAAEKTLRSTGFAGMFAADRLRSCAVGAPNPAATADVGLNGEWKYVDGTPTLRIYNKGEAIVVAVRGTADAVDLEACLSTINHNLENQTRYQEDKKFILEFESKYPRSNGYNYLLTGHSLGGALSDQLMHDGIGIQAITFNPAVQKAFYQSINNKRIYQARDPLYQMMGRYCQNNVEVLNTFQPDWMNKALSATGFSGQGLAAAWAASGAHALASFNDSFKDKPLSDLQQETLSEQSVTFQDEAQITAVEDSAETVDLTMDTEHADDFEGYSDNSDLHLAELYEDLDY